MFLADNNCTGLARFIPGCATLQGVGLDEAATDKEIFDFATSKQLTIVTQDDADFTAIMRHAMHTSGRTNCAGEGYGLLVPNSVNTISFGDVTRRLHFAGKQIDWVDVRIFNLKVSLGKERDPIVSTLPRCKHCIELSNEEFGTRYRELGLDKIPLR